MQIGNVSTPFGRRSMTLALVKNQLDTANAESCKSVDKWKVFRCACEARTLLGITQPALSVLNALLSFYPETELSEDAGLVVFPSNNQLSVRAHGMSGTTLRRHLAALVETGLIIRKDSPNGKRYARKDRSGVVETAFGFSLAPMLARAEELAQMAQQIEIDKKALRLAKERLTLCRRDIRKLITAAMEEGASGDWALMESQYIGLVARISRNPSMSELLSITPELEALRTLIINMLEKQVNFKKTDGNDDQNGWHIQNSNTNHPTESEPSFEPKQGETDVAYSKPRVEPIKAFPLSMVLRACPTMGDYGQGGVISSWRDLMAAAVLVRAMLGISPSAYQDACDVMGQEGAAAAVACILERGGHINSPGAYLRDLTRRAARGEFSLGPVLMALIRANGGSVEKAG
ncbi:plasmid replication protein RepC [Rhizobium sp.]|jgi:replication initiation protein RepC|uniref:plasmid replication protein RepC n=1 Tax=Rhizobium sp. TaxID=391 RepID=UPI000E8CB05B|nr:replication initiation protein RepC [Rhizobium sp.]